ncbi:MAG: PstS family phosphate ABC transporter substrate-binding protein [Phycisphaerales bacterium]
MFDVTRQPLMTRPTFRRTRTILAAATLCTVATGLAGCGSGSEPTPPRTTSTAPAPTTPATDPNQPASGAPSSSSATPSGGSSAASPTNGAAIRVDPTLPRYDSSSSVTGNIKSVGSDTMNNLMALWGEDFQSLHPSVTIEVEGKGSSTAPPALIAGTSTFGPMSRAMKSSEIDEFEAAFGYKPLPIRTAIDMLAVFVHKDNPIAATGLTLEQVDGIFSETRRSGADEIRTWGDLGLTGEWADKPISLYGRNSASGTYGYFKSVGLFKGDFKPTVKEQPGSSAVIQGVASDRYAIGYSGIGYATADVIALRIADKNSPISAAVAPRPEDAADYPLARFLYLYVNYRPGSDLPPLQGEFVQFVLSADGQQAVIKDGYIPVAGAIARADREKLNLPAD